MLPDERSAFKIYNMAITGFSIIFFVIATSYRGDKLLLGVPYTHLLCGVYSTIIFLNLSYISDRIYRGDILTLLVDPSRIRKVFGLGIMLIIIYTLYVALRDFTHAWAVPEDLLLLYSILFDIYVIYILINVSLIFGSIIHGIYLLYLIAKLYEYASKLPLEITTQEVLLSIGIMLYVVCTIYAIIVPYRKMGEYNDVLTRYLATEQKVSRDLLASITGKDITPRDLVYFSIATSTITIYVELIDRETFRVRKIELGHRNINFDHTIVLNPERYMIVDISIYP